MKTIGQIIKISRINKNLSQDEVAEEIGVSKNYISQVENDKKSPSLKFLSNISGLLKIPQILLIWKKIDKTKEREKDKELTKQLENLIEKAQKIFIDVLMDKE